MMDQAEWVIAWQNKAAGTKGYGEPMPYDEARARADHLNATRPRAWYWLETAADVEAVTPPAYYVVNERGERVPLVEALAALGIVTDGGK
jgi:hypothetical protein